MTYKSLKIDLTISLKKLIVNIKAIYIALNNVYIYTIILNRLPYFPQ